MDNQPVDSREMTDIVRHQRNGMHQGGCRNPRVSASYLASVSLTRIADLRPFHAEAMVEGINHEVPEVFL